MTLNYAAVTHVLTGSWGVSRAAGARTQALTDHDQAALEDEPELPLRLRAAQVCQARSDGKWQQQSLYFGDKWYTVHVHEE